ncbi:MAG TPA: VOC family protein [Steroidobacteraceae bacterium]|nr:VOC family protein [Steroidobacteraceae bacterium]
MGEQQSGPVRFQRANVVVRDLDRALAFYRDILGFEVAFIKDSPEVSYSYTVFEIPKEAKLRFCVLSTATQPRVLALTEVTEAVVPSAPIPRLGAMVLEIENVDEVLEALSKAGHKVYPEERLVTQDGRVGREIGCLDPDGNLVVLYRITGRVA